MSNYRSKAIDEYGEECVECGSTESIDVHHKDGDRTNNSLENLIPLCAECHSERHDGYTFNNNQQTSSLTQITVRLVDGDLDEVERRCDGTPQSRSDVIRTAVSEFLNDEEDGEETIKRLESRIGRLEDERDYLRTIVRNLTE